MNINRIIFSSIVKRKGQDLFEKLTEFEVRQISGRAGRNENDGFVNAFNQSDLDYVRHCLKKSTTVKSKKVNEEFNLTDNPHFNFTKTELLIEKACLFPPLQTILDFADALSKFTNKPINKISLSDVLHKYIVLINQVRIYS